MKIKYTPLLLLFILPFLNSCVNNADFDQIELDIEPVFNTPLVYFELNQLDFLDDTGAIEIQTVTDLTDLEIFQSSVVRDNLIRVNFDFLITNTFNRRFLVQTELLNSSNDVVYAFQPLNIAPGADSFSQGENIVVSDNPQILNATRARVTITLVPVTSTLDPDVEQRLEFRSSGTFYLRI